MSTLLRVLKVASACLSCLDDLFVAVAILAFSVIGVFTGLRWLFFAILAGDRVVIALTAAILGGVLAWPAIRDAS